MKYITPLLGFRFAWATLAAGIVGTVVRLEADTMPWLSRAIIIVAGAVLIGIWLAWPELQEKP